ncbi:DUF1641 domain-containing protein [Pseudomonas sp. CCI3.1]|uniref:DUF1641 domain-containing protein n=1 Tax=Pseudomonas sp. CCI3.1 TaxID=3048618 RepID=UPI002AB4E0C4|nr:MULTISPECIES: DUF1641 domain-containing protein [unclassified Pseudomonas]MDY7584366.1 DUF1641 domain-containing protein [Pseudomonas sp. CCI3.1]MEB0065542.1 DUF1641 domain-containing protein [Pseudomonas sp. CCI3.1]MEB0071150.1 DUF1641 domain-containing protein [Pseudomonas sp. CCI1.4]
MDVINEPPAKSANINPESLEHNSGLEALLGKLQPLLDAGRLDNLVDLMSLLSDTVDLLDLATVEKLARLFEDTTTFTWSLGNALRMAAAETAAEAEPPSLYGLLSLLREKDTRRGVALVLRTLNVIGRQL